MRFKAFNVRYRMLASSCKIRCVEERAIEDCRLILQRIEQKCDLKQQHTEVSMSWAFGKRHIFLRWVWYKYEVKFFTRRLSIEFWFMRSEVIVIKKIWKWPLLWARVEKIHNILTRVYVILCILVYLWTCFEEKKLEFKPTFVIVVQIVIFWNLYFIQANTCRNFEIFQYFSSLCTYCILLQHLREPLNWWEKIFNLKNPFIAQVVPNDYCKMTWQWKLDFLYLLEKKNRKKYNNVPTLMK